MTIDFEDLQPVAAFYEVTARSLRRRMEDTLRHASAVTTDNDRVLLAADLEFATLEGVRGLETWGMWLRGVGRRIPNVPLVVKVRKVDTEDAFKSVLRVLDPQDNTGARLRLPDSASLRTSLLAYGQRGREAATDRFLEEDGWGGLRHSLAEMAMNLTALDTPEISATGFEDAYNSWKHGSVGAREVRNGQPFTLLMRRDGSTWQLGWPTNEAGVRKLYNNTTETWDRLANFVSLIQMLRLLGLLDPSTE